MQILGIFQLAIYEPLVQQETSLKLSCLGVLVEMCVFDFYYRIPTNLSQILRKSLLGSSYDTHRMFPKPFVLQRGRFRSSFSIVSDDFPT